MTSAFAKFYGNMDWFDVDEDFEGVELPQCFEDAKRLWLENREENISQVIALLTPFVKAWFVPAAINDSDDLFPDQSDFPALRIHVAGIDFSSDPFPLCKAEAWFDVPVSEIFAKTDLDQRQEETGEYFYQAISFGWQIPTSVKGESIVFTYANNQGVECIPNVDI